jgi:hypothetical protein
MPILKLSRYRLNYRIGLIFLALVLDSRRRKRGAHISYGCYRLDVEGKCPAALKCCLQNSTDSVCTVPSAIISGCVVNMAINADEIQRKRASMRRMMNGFSWEPLSESALKKFGDESRKSNFMRSEPDNSGFDFDTAIQLMRRTAETNEDVSDLFPDEIDLGD